MSADEERGRIRANREKLERQLERQLERNRTFGRMLVERLRDVERREDELDERERAREEEQI